MAPIPLMNPDDFTPEELATAANTLLRSTFQRDPLQKQLAETALFLAALPAPPAEAVLIFRRPATGVVEAVAIGSGLVVGRGEGCQIRLEGRQELSRRHFALVPEGDQFFVEDLQSSNGTAVEGAPEKLGRRELRDGDLIRAGGIVFLFIKPV
jgi:hypothetical protein